MNTKLEALKKWGCDITGSLERFVNDEDLYVSCLDMFIEDESFTELPLAIANEQWEDAFNHAHSLKGVSGNLGLTPLFDKICALVEALRHQEYDKAPALLKAFLAALEQYKKIVAY